MAISARQIDRRLQPHKLELKRHMYGRTKPGTLLKHQIPIRTQHWSVTEPGYVEIDLVSYSGSHAEGDFIYSLNLTDIFTGWTETRAVMGKGQRGVVAALDAAARRSSHTLPLGFPTPNPLPFRNRSSRVPIFSISARVGRAHAHSARHSKSLPPTASRRHS